VTSVRRARSLAWTCLLLASAQIAVPALAESPPAPLEIVVTGVRKTPEPNSVTLPSAQASKAPGTQGDPAKVVESLPGMARSSFDSGALVLWGASPTESRVLVDGVEIPRLFHGSGIRSTVSGELLQSVTLTPGAYSADYGRALGGLVRLETRDLPSDRPHAVVDASTLDGAVAASSPLGERVRVALGARYGWLDRTLEVVDAPDVSAYYAVPRYADYHGKAQVALRDGEGIDLVVLGSHDDLERTIPDADPARVRSQSTHAGFERAYLRYRRTFEDGSTAEVVPWLGWDHARSDAYFGESPARLARESFRLGLRALHRSRAWSGATLGLGVDVASDQADLSREGSLTIPPREGDVSVFGEPPGDDTNVDQWRTLLVNVAPHATLDLELGPLSLTPSLRFDGYLSETSRQTPRVGKTPSIGRSSFQGVLEPRIAAALRLSRRAVLLGSAGLYSQPPAPEDQSAVFGTPTLGVERAVHASIGQSAELSSTSSVTTLGFYRSLTELAVRDPSPTPKLAYAFLQNGTGRSYGVQILLRQRPWHGFSGWLAYTVSRSERRDAPAAAERLFDWDQPNLLTLVATQVLGGWSLGARFRYASGAPRTPVTGALFAEPNDVFQPLFGAHNAERLPDFWQLDARVDRAFALDPRSRLTLYLEVLNVLNHANAEEYLYSSDYTTRAVVTGLPVVGVFGARLDL